MEDAESLRVRAWTAARDGYHGDAMILFRRIVAEYPDSEAAKDAKEFIEGRTPKPAQVPLDAPTQRVTVVDIDISFPQLVNLIVKATFAMLFVWLFFGAIGFVLFFVIGRMAAAG